MSTIAINHPELAVINDYDNTFLTRVQDAIVLNINSGIEMYPEITINAGPYRPYCFAYSSEGKRKINLDFYAASRVFGFEHTIEDIAKAIAL